MSAVTSSDLVARTKSDITEVTAREVHDIVDAGGDVHLVDIREREEVLDGFIPNAALIPRGFLELDI